MRRRRRRRPHSVSAAGDFAATEKRTHDYVRHRTTNLFAALNIATGEVFGECKSNRNKRDRQSIRCGTLSGVHVLVEWAVITSTPGMGARNPSPGPQPPGRSFSNVLFAQTAVKKLAKKNSN